MMNDNTTQAALQQLIQDDAIGQLRRRDGLMTTLSSENGALKLDWVEGVARLLADPAQLEQVEAEARGIWQRGMRHLIWAGMGGSVLTVRVLCQLGFCGGQDQEQVSIYPLDSTDPAALNEIVRTIAAAKKLTLPSGEAATSPTFLRALLGDVMMVGVAMGMTSEEPITHLEWFTALLQQAGLRPAEHLLVMSLPDSYLDHFARAQQAPSLPLQPDAGTGTGGRMSAPTTRVFLLPAALYLTTHFPDQSGLLRSVLQQTWDEYNLQLATTQAAAHPFVQLAAALSAASLNGACRLLVRMPEGWQALVAWLEQLLEESLGKGGRGIVVFDEQALNHTAPGYREDGLLHVHVVTQATQPARGQHFVLLQPSLASQEPRGRLAALAASFLGWQLSMALYGYLQRIQFAGQPAVENYKARARALRTQPDPLLVALMWRPAWYGESLTLLGPHGASDQQQSNTQTPGQAFASVLRQVLAPDETSERSEAIPPGYLDLTVNGEAPASMLSMLDEQVHMIGNRLLGVPVKLRRAPADYHSTEQSEMDGPPSLVSLRLVARNTAASLLGSYANAFLHAQAVSTWQAMMEVGRPCFLLIIDGSLGDALEPLATFFSHVEEYLRHV